MRFIKLENQPNIYPDVNSYKRKVNQIKLEGKFNDNSISFNVTDLSKLNISETTSFRFVVNMISENSQLWTSRPFYDDLQAAIQENNPYFNINEVPIVKFDLAVVLKYPTLNRFTSPENYAEANVTATLDTTEKILEHIDWASSGARELRPVSDFGSWKLNTTLFVAQNEQSLNEVDKDEISEATQISDNITIQSQRSSGTSVGNFTTFRKEAIQ